MKKNRQPKNVKPKSLVPFFKKPFLGIFKEIRCFEYIFSCKRLGSRVNISDIKIISNLFYVSIIELANSSFFLSFKTNQQVFAKQSIKH